MESSALDLYGSSHWTSVLRSDPDLAHRLCAREFEQAAAACHARVLHLRPGGLAGWPLEREPEPGHQGLLVLRGLLSVRMEMRHRHGAELLGPGDLLRPWKVDGDSTLPVTAWWRVHEPAELAVLDRRYQQLAAPWPELDSALRDREIARVRSLMVRLLIAQIPRISERVHVLLWHLSDRWGRIGPSGVILPLRLSRALLAELVCSTRESVSRALTRLELEQRVVPFRGGFLLLGPPPGEHERDGGHALAGAS